MLSTEFRQSDTDWNPSETLVQHAFAESSPGYWDEVERDLAENPDVWALPDYEEYAQ